MAKTAACSVGLSRVATQLRHMDVIRLWSDRWQAQTQDTTGSYFFAIAGCATYRIQCLADAFRDLGRWLSAAAAFRCEC